MTPEEREQLRQELAARNQERVKRRERRPKHTLVPQRWVALPTNAPCMVPHPFRFAGTLQEAREHIAPLFAPVAGLVVVPLEEWFEVAAAEVENDRAGAVRAGWAMSQAGEP